MFTNVNRCISSDILPGSVTSSHCGPDKARCDKVAKDLTYRAKIEVWSLTIYVQNKTSKL